MEYSLGYGQAGVLYGYGFGARLWAWMGEGTHVLAASRVAVSRLGNYDEEGRHISSGILPKYMLRAMEQNQKMKSCCRKPWLAEVEARYTSDLWRRRLKVNPISKEIEQEKRGGRPDLYIFRCTCCNSLYRHWILGDGTPRPVWPADI